MAIKKDQVTHGKNKKKRFYLYMAIKKANITQREHRLLEHYSVFLRTKSLKSQYPSMCVCVCVCVCVCCVYTLHFLYASLDSIRQYICYIYSIRHYIEYLVGIHSLEKSVSQYIFICYIQSQCPSIFATYKVTMQNTLHITITSLY